MPGRQSTKTLSIRKPKPKNKKNKRALNALAIAEQQQPERVGIRRNRLGESEPQGAKRQRQADEDEDSEDGQGASATKRRRGQKDRYGNEIELGSDSSGNEWMIGQVDSEADSSLDSDEAMGPSDDENFEGFIFRGSSSTKSKKKKKGRRAMLDRDAENEGSGEIDLNENEEVEASDDSDGLGDDAVDLATLLDDGESDGPPKSSKKSRLLEGSVSKSETDGKTDDDTSSAEEDHSELSVSEDEDENDMTNANKLASLQNLVSMMEKSDQNSFDSQAPNNIHESITPSEFGLTSERKLTVADLMPSVTDPQLRKSLKLVAESDSKGGRNRNGIPKKLDAPLPKRQQDRIDRAAAYEKSKETLNRWIDTVKHNRRAEHLSFPLQDPDAVAAKGSQRMVPNNQSKPLADLEVTVASILQESGLAPQNGKTEEDQLQAFEELQTNKMPIEEVQARRAELRRARELLFREEIRAKRIKRIKSKSYRKIHRKERERNAQLEKDALVANGIDDSESEKERNDRRRAEERMGARHRESRWAKGIKDSGRSKWDEDARSGVNEMARRGEELRRRIEGKQVRDDDDEGDDNSMSPESDYGEDEDEILHDKEAQSQRNSERLRSLKQDGSIGDGGARGSRLMAMDFMKKAEAAESARNDVELETLRRELAGEETPSDEEPEEAPGKKSYGPPKVKTLPDPASRNTQRSEFEEKGESVDEGENGNGLAEEEDVDIIIEPSVTRTVQSPGPGKYDEPKASKYSSLQYSVINRKVVGGPWNEMDQKASKTSSGKGHEPRSENRMMNDFARKAHANIQQMKPRSALKGAREAAKSLRTVQTKRPAMQAEDNDSGNEDDDTDRLPFVLRNQEYISQAFAGDNVALDFSKEKEDLIHGEEDKIVDNTLPGWGNWTGDGIGKKAQKRNRNKVLTKIPGVAREMRQDAKLDKVIINGKRVKKNTKYLASNLPHPFETRQQYERSLRLPVGPEWTTTETFQAATKPRILTKPGVILPMERPVL